MGVCVGVCATSHFASHHTKQPPPHHLPFLLADVDILAGVTNTSAIPYILGGETEMWGETADGSDVLQTIWPRAAAAAERQWSYDVTGKADGGVAYRLQAFRCWLLERGIAAAPVTNSQARSAPAGPGSCMSQ